MIPSCQTIRYCYLSAGSFEGYSRYFNPVCKLGRSVRSRITRL